MKPHLQIIFCLISILMILNGCKDSTNETPCHLVLRGKVVSTSHTCAGVAVQIISGNYSPSRVDKMWREIYNPQSIIYEDVFKVYGCDLENDIESIFNDSTHSGDPSKEFNFVFMDPDGKPSFNEDCVACDLLVSLPEARNRIMILAECEEVVEN